MAGQRGSVLDRLNTPFGPLAPPHRRRLKRVLVNPTQQTWDDAYTVILRHERGLHLTLWMCVLAVDPNFPRSKPLEDSWPQVPDQLTLARALRYAREARPQLR